MVSNEEIVRDALVEPPEKLEADLRATEGLATDERERRIAAEAEVTRLREALETIWRMHDIPIGGESHSAAMREVARAALTKETP